MPILAICLFDLNHFWSLGKYSREKLSQVVGKIDPNETTPSVSPKHSKRSTGSSWTAADGKKSKKSPHSPPKVPAKRDDGRFCASFGTFGSLLGVVFR